MSLLNRERGMAIVALGLAIVVPWQLVADHDPPADIPLAAVVTPIKLEPVEGLGLVYATALFSRGRTPAGTEAAQASAGVPQAEQTAAAPTPTLVGLATRVQGAGVALVKRSDGQTVTAARGDMVDGWRVAGIDRDQVIFEQGTERRTVTLDFSNKGEPAAPGPSTPPVVAEAAEVSR